MRLFAIFAVLSIAGCASQNTTWEYHPWVATVPMYDASDPPPSQSFVAREDCPQCFARTRFSTAPFGPIGVSTGHYR